MDSDSFIPSWRFKDLSQENTPFRIDDREAWRNADIGHRLQYHFHEMMVPHPGFVEQIRAIHKALDRCELCRSGLMIFLEAPTGSGKTALLRFLTKIHPRVEHPEFSEIPVLAIRVPPVVSMRAMAIALLEALGDPTPKGGNNTEAIMARAFFLLRKARTALVIIDNIHDITEKRAARGIRHIGSWLRDFVDVFAGLVLALGTNDGAPVLDDYLQAKRRAPGRLRSSFFDVTNPGFKRFLHEVDLRLPLADLSGLSSGDFSSRIAFATGGIQDYIFKLLGFSIPYAVKGGREALTLDDLAAGFDELFQDSGKGLNPFREQVDHVLCRDGEPLSGFVQYP